MSASESKGLVARARIRANLGGIGGETLTPTTDARSGACAGDSNRTDSPVRVLMPSTLVAPDIVEYLDSGKVGARSVAGERILLSRPGPILDYWDGED